jgi:hypothetical protein
MAQLTQTEVFRKGRTAPDWSVESTQCMAFISKDDCSLSVRFDVASKGGGTTCLLIKIGSADVRSLLLELAGKRPDTAGTFAEAITIAIQENARILDKVRDLTLMEKLESVEDFVYNTTAEDQSGEDDRENAIVAVGDVIRTIKSLRLD